MHKDILIIADIEGSSGCWDYESSSYKTEKWAHACLDMSLDIDSVVKALFKAGAEKITVKDFHRTGYNLLPEFIDPGAEIVSGYRRGPVPGLGRPGNATALMMIGMHASSGSGGFLAHTLTSRIERLEVNGKLMCEAELFSASLEPFNIHPVFFSGCPVACAEAKNAIKGITIFSIDKPGDPGSFNKEKWRDDLAAAAVSSLSNISSMPHKIDGPFTADITMRDGEKTANKLASRWGYKCRGSKIVISEENIHSLYYALIRLCYLTPFIERILLPALLIYNLAGRRGRYWVRERLKMVFTSL